MNRKWTYAAILLGLLAVAAFVFGFRNFDRKAPNTLPANSFIPENPPAEETPAPVETVPLFHYIEIIGGCNWAWSGTCVNMRSGPGTEYPVVLRLRPGIVLKVEADTTPGDGHDWYKVVFDKELRYPERVHGDWYIAADPESVRPFEDPGESNLKPDAPITTNKRIVVDLSKEMLYAYDGTDLFMEESISTGVDLDPTPVGTFSIYKKTPSRYMQGPLPGVSDQYYDLPGVPWDLYFTLGGAVLHGAYWHNDFGEPRSHGCVNQTPENAKKLYEWADLGTPVTVQQ